jgi:formate dehydrogenase iron-sulfur subunit
MKTLKTLALIGLLAILAAIGAAVYFFGEERVIKRGYGSGSWGWLTAYHEGIAV